MIAFEVYVNGDRVGTAGVGDLGVLSAILTWVRRSGKSRNGQSFEEALTFEVTALAEHAQLGWLRRELIVGDSVALKIVSVETVDAPSSSEPRDDAAAVQEGERRYFEHLEKKYGGKRTRPARPR